MIIGDAALGHTEVTERIREAANRLYRENAGVACEKSAAAALERPAGAGAPGPCACASDAAVPGACAAPSQSEYYFIEASRADGAAKRPAPSGAQALRKDFPALSRRVNGKPLIWLDNAATSQKPRCVIDALRRFYEERNSNIHRGAHTMAREATEAYENARDKVRAFLGAAQSEEIVFVRGTTEAINLVAASWGAANVGAGDEIILTEMEHHSNIVPWQMLAQRAGAYIKVAPIDQSGAIDLGLYERLFTPRTRIVAAAHVSNVLGTVNPVRAMADIAHANGARFLVDGAQSAPHIPVDIQALDADFFAFSGHKAYGPTGIGALYGKRALLDSMAPYQGGGGMIDAVTFRQTTFKGSPDRFEAGTGSIADAVGLGAAADYLKRIGLESVRAHEAILTEYLMNGLALVPGVTLVGTAPGKTSVVSFVVDGIEPETMADYLDKRGIAVRAGHHCAQPALAHFGLKGTVRASIGLYNTMEELDALVGAVAEAAKRRK